MREVARLYARGPNSMIFWGMGISQHIHGTDNARCLIALALMTGQIGRRGTGLHPLRGQNNVQGASDAGLIPMMFPDYQRVADPAVRARFEALWHPAARPARPHRGRDHGRRGGGRIRGMYIEGENPAMSDPDLAHARAALASLEHLVVQDLFLTETAMLADVILPASSLMERPAASPTPTGWCNWPGRCCRCPARRAPTGGSSSRWPGASASTGTPGSGRDLRGTAPGDAELRRHQLGRARNRGRGDLAQARCRPGLAAGAVHR